MLDNKLLLKVQSYCRIIGSLRNEFRKCLGSDKKFLEEVLPIMKARKNLDNTLATEVETNQWARRKVSFEDIKSNKLLDCLEMTEEDFKILFTGYQLLHAVSHLAEMMDNDDNINVQCVKNNFKILKI